MNRRNILNEINRLPKFLVRFSDEITEKIEDVDFLNQFEEEKLKEWHDFLDGMVSRISEPVIAWDNMNIFQHDEGIHHIQIDGSYGYDVLYTFEEDEETGITYIYVFNANLRISQHGLELPFGVYESQRPRKNLNESLKEQPFLSLFPDNHWTRDSIKKNGTLEFYTFNPSPGSLLWNIAIYSTPWYQMRNKRDYVRLFKQINLKSATIIQYTIKGRFMSR